MTDDRSRELSGAVNQSPAPVLGAGAREAIARIIYDAFPFDGDPIHKQKPDWIPGGNSIKQDDARRAADAILALPALADTVTDTGGRAQAPAVLAEDFGHWLFMDCEQAVYDCGGLAEEILKYFDVRPREGLAVSSTDGNTP